jgi:threonine dehydrogenase-like Zn-dependent dehydrogenase
MRAASYEASGHFAIDERAAAEPGPGQVRVRVEACGICGSDLHHLHHGLFRAGQTPGHEIAGRIERVGAGVSGVSEGQAVAVEPLESCGTCGPCRSGMDSICRRMRVHGIHMAGGLAEQIVVSAHRVYPLADGLDPAVAALAEPVAVAVHGLERGGFAPGQRVLVMGAGAVGLVTLIAARSLGAGEVFITARHAHQAERARAFGAARVIDERDATAASLDEIGREHDIDLAVETVGGHADTLATAAAAVRPGGRISVLGLFMESPKLAPLPLLLKELTLGWSNCYHRATGRPADFAVAADIVDREREQLASLITHRFALGEVDAAFTRAADKSSGALKVSVRIP